MVCSREASKSWGQKQNTKNHARVIFHPFAGTPHWGDRFEEMFHHESLKPIYFGVKRSEVKVTRHKKVCVGLQMERIIDACCVRQLRWVFPAVDAAADRWIFYEWSFSQRQKKHRQRGSRRSLECWLRLVIFVVILVLFLIVSCAEIRWFMILLCYRWMSRTVVDGVRNWRGSLR